MTTTPIPHGTLSGYSHHKCRCDECKAVKSATDRAAYERRIGRPVRTPMTEAEKSAKAVARVKAWRKANPEKAKALQAKYREAHQDELRAKGRERFAERMETEPDKVRAERLAWAQTPQGRLSYRNAQERRRRQAPYTKEAIAWILKLVDPVCAYCGEPATEIDHIVPISRGGTGEIDNLAPSCRSCNARKGALTGDEFVNGKPPGP